MADNTAAKMAAFAKLSAFLKKGETGHKKESAAPVGLLASLGTRAGKWTGSALPGVSKYMGTSSAKARVLARAKEIMEQLKQPAKGRSEINKLLRKEIGGIGTLTPKGRKFTPSTEAIQAARERARNVVGAGAAGVGALGLGALGYGASKLMGGGKASVENISPSVVNTLNLPDIKSGSAPIGTPFTDGLLRHCLEMNLSGTQVADLLEKGAADKGKLGEECRGLIDRMSKL